MDTIKSKLLKILALTDSPVSGERAAAKRMLHDLCRKYHVHPDTLLSPDRELRRFKHRGGRDCVLLILCMKFIVGSLDRKARSAPRFIDLDVTNAERIDITDMIRHYRKAYRKDTEDFWVAFVNRHDLAPKDAHVSKNICAERLERLLMFMRGIQSDTWVRPKARLNGTDSPVGLPIAQ
jgi:hypothetical protein